MEMENPIFRKLQDTIEHPCRSTDWFGMAEQAINTIYALGEHPDQLCNDLVKNLTRRAFAKRQKPELPAEGDVDAEMVIEDDPIPVSHAPSSMSSTQILSQQSNMSEEKDLGDVFHLSQLLFVVGHVAIKQIVFLELVEREWKRQKDEKQLGMFNRRHLQTSQ
jgi:condensin complex subunit 1